MKTKFLQFLVVVTSIIFLSSCQDEPLTPDYETLCSFTTDNYKVGDRVVFERTNGQLDTLIVKLVEQKLYAESSKHLNDSAKNANTFAEIRIEMSDDEGNNGWYHLVLACSLHYRFEYLMDGIFTWDNSHKDPYYDGASFILQSISSDILRTRDMYVSFAELKKGVGIARFGDRDGEIWTLKERL